MGVEKGKMTIREILSSLPGDTVLLALDGTVLGSKCQVPEAGYKAWPYVSLFSGTDRACRLYWRVPGGYDPALTIGPLELLLGDLVGSGAGYWLRRLLTEPPEAVGLDRLPQEAGSCVPLRLSVLRIAPENRDEAQKALRSLLPKLETVSTEAGTLLLKLPMDSETAQEWTQSALALLGEELLLDPLIVTGAAVLQVEGLYRHAQTLQKLSERLYRRGNRGSHALLEHLPELIMGKLTADPQLLVEALGEAIVPILQEQDLALTADAFIRNNLSVTETAQSLYLHRNTLVYRLGKIERLSGLDLKRLDHALAYLLLKAGVEQPE